MKKKTILITGATSGIGLSIAGHLHAVGHDVIGAARNPDRAVGAAFRLVKLDVDSDDSVSACVNEIAAAGKRIDVLINNAGVGIAGSVEETSAEEAKAQFETNYFGAARMCRAALPGMRAAGKGLIINISSLGGLASAPFHAHYCASKFAIEGLSEGLRMEVAPFGVNVVLVEPGDFKTGFTAGRKVAAEACGSSPYNPRFAKSLKKMEESEMNGPDPIMIAKLVARIIDHPSPKFRYAVAAPPQNLMPALKRFLPWSAIEKIISSHYGG